MRVSLRFAAMSRSGGCGERAIAPDCSALHARGVQTLAPGFLIAMPQLGDPNFHKSVILMLEHSDTGSMGLIVNRQAPATFKDLQQENLKVPRSRTLEPIFMGGPVEPQRGFVLHDRDGIPERIEVLPGLYLSVTMDALQGLLHDADAQIRFCLGYSGWGPKQLETEIAQGSWIFTEANPKEALEGEPGKLWDNAVRSMGFDPAMLLSGKGIH